MRLLNFIEMQDKLFNATKGQAISFVLGAQVHPRVPRVVSVVNLSTNGAPINIKKVSKSAAYDDTWVFKRGDEVITLAHPEVQYRGTDYSFNLVFASNMKSIMPEEIKFWVTEEEEILTATFAAGKREAPGVDDMIAVIRIPRTAYYQIGNIFYSCVTGKPLNDTSVVNNKRLRRSVSLNSIVNRQYI